jgi:translocator protein
LSPERNRVFQITDPDRWGLPPGSSTPVSPTFALIGFVGLSLLVCLADSALGASASHWYLSLARPPGTPPEWLFVSIWGVLCVLMGIGGWLVWRRSISIQPLRLWGWQLAVNAVWAPAFFGLHRPLFGAVVLVVLIPLLALTIWRFTLVSRTAACLLIPSLLATGYSLYLSAGFYCLNPG